MKCKFCGYEWKNHDSCPNPISCPRCKRRTDYPFKLGDKNAKP